MKRLNTLALLISLSGILSAQVPGYLGKKLSIGYKADISPVGFNRFFSSGQGANYDGSEETILSTGLTHSVDLEYVISRKVALRFAYGFSKGGMLGNSTNIEEPLFIEAQYPKLSKEVDFRTNDARDFDYMNMNTRLLKAGLTFTRGNYIAPHGRSHTLYFLSNIASCNYVLGDKSNALTTIQSYGVMYERTSRRIIKDCILLEYGFAFGYLFGSGIGGDWDAETAAKYVTGYQNTQLLFQGTLGIRYLVPKIKM